MHGNFRIRYHGLKCLRSIGLSKLTCILQAFISVIIGRVGKIAKIIDQIGSINDSVWSPLDARKFQN